MIRRILQFGICIATWVLVTHAGLNAYASLIISTADVDVMAAPAAMSTQATDESPVDPLQLSEKSVPDGAIPGAGTPSGSVTTSVAGHAAIIADTFLALPPLVARFLCDPCLIFPNPPPTSLLRPPRETDQIV